MMRLWLVSVSLCVPSLAIAGGYSTPIVEARDMAMAGTTVGCAETAAAAYANPAALSKLDGLVVDFSGSVADLSTSWRNNTAEDSSTTAETRTKIAPPVALSAAYGTELFGRRLGVGLSFNVPGGGGVFWRKGWPGRYKIISVDRKVFGLYLTAGYQVIDQLRVGAGLVGYYTTEELTQAANPQFPEIIGTINDHGGGVSFDVSAELEPVTGIPLTIGVDYKHEAKQAMTGEVSNTNTTPALLATVPVLADQNITHDLTFPSVLNVGVSYEPIADLLLSVAWTWTGYSVYQDDLYLGEDYNQPIVAGGEAYEAIAEVPRDYGNGNTFRLGVEWDATSRLALRGGVARDLSGMPTADNASVLINTTASPTLPDSHSWTGTVGLAYELLAGLSLQAAFLYMRMDEKLSPGSEATPQADPYPGVYNARALIGAIGVSWKPWTSEGS